MIVVKIGGSSLRTKSDFLNAADIIKSDCRRKIAVVSSPGKRYEDDEKITDLLIRCCEEKVSTAFSLIVERFKEISKGLSCEERVNSELLKLEKDIKSNAYRDFILSRGEYISAVIMASLLNYKLVDAKDVIFFKENGKPDEEKSRKALKKYYSQYERLVIPGFYGRSFDGKIKTFPRGGGDITGSYISALLSAEKYENMTDVEGLFKFPPDIIKAPPKVKSLSLYDLKLLSHFGAKVFNEGAVKPLIKYNVPLEIKSTFLNKDGTFSCRAPETPDKISGVGYLQKEGCTLLLTAGKILKKGFYEAFLLNALSEENIFPKEIKALRKTSAFILSIPSENFKRAVCIIYKRTENF